MREPDLVTLSNPASSPPLDPASSPPSVVVSSPQLSSHCSQPRGGNHGIVVPAAGCCSLPPSPWPVGPCRLALIWVEAAPQQLASRNCRTGSSAAATEQAHLRISGQIRIGMLGFMSSVAKVFSLPALALLPPSRFRLCPPVFSSGVHSRLSAAAPFLGPPPAMPILACVLPAVTILCQPVLDAFQACVGDQAQRFLTFLANWAGGLFARCWESPAEDVPESAAVVVGAEEILSEIRNHLRDESVGIIGIYGMGGVGKTTILQRIHNELLESGRRGSFDLVLWVTVSQSIRISDIQRQIGDRLGLSLSADSSAEEENARVLFKLLSKKRFLVLLDDLWEALDLHVKIRIPSPRRQKRNSKIVFTTRSSQVCWDMEADKSVPVVHRCGGLPLSLVTVGRAMANRVLRQEWEYAVEALDHYTEQLHGMEKVLGCLKFSFDYLKKDNMRSALLFCAMYPEDQDIWIEQIIKYWFGEGLLDDGDVAGGSSIDGTRNRGHFLISELQDACLLQPGMSNPLLHVRMHDAVRDMGRWLNSREYDKVDGFLVHDGVRAANSATGAVGREHVKRIWVRDIDLFKEETSDLAGILNSPSNQTALLLTGVRGLGPSILQGIAGFKTTLRVLDLSHSDVEELPGEVGLMVELRYLELASTRLRALPRELGNLINLRILGLRFLQELQIPREAIAGLSSLQFLDMFGCPYDWEAADSDGGGGGGRQLELGDLESGLRRLQELHIQLETGSALGRVLKSDRLCRCTRSLYLEKPNRRRHRQSEDPLYGEGGSSVLQGVIGKMGSSLRNLFLGDDVSHPWVGALRISLDRLPRLEILSLWSFKKLSEFVLVGTDISRRSGITGRTPPSSIPYPILDRLYMCDFNGLKVLKLVGGFPFLNEINLSRCSAMEELALDDGVEAGTGGEGTQEPGGGLLDRHFPMLRLISLFHLPALKSIGLRPLRLPELRSIALNQCPELRRIPLDAAGVPKLENILGEQKWWDAVDCVGSGGHNTKPVFENLFIEAFF
ncbi:hypothetical protein Taro_022204 [Colocasia esculenta]|uniref:AAA+ ATPase domain-containing protein n=1 Tax=Colocasia esculenta TaxID=4460 RepID=A0A843V171_COLES|nr:hypothetical protein [Colocasia esculenta]